MSSSPGIKMEIRFPHVRRSANGGLENLAARAPFPQLPTKCWIGFNKNSIPTLLFKKVCLTVKSRMVRSNLNEKPVSSLAEVFPD
jgi:hypothetical protein